MHETRRGPLFTFGVAVLAVGATLVLRLLLWPELHDVAPHQAFFPAVMIAAYLGGWWPGLLATLLGALTANVVLTPPYFVLGIKNVNAAVALPLYLLVGIIISILMESLHRSHRRIAASERRYAVTLSSIGDAVLATDNQARVTFLNPVAETLTGWTLADAVGRPLAEVFHLVDVQTRKSVEDPASEVFRSGTAVGLAHHTVLLARDGREVPIDDCSAPIIDDRSGTAGVVLVFRDITQRRQAEEAEVFRRANERMELAVRGSNVGVWEVEYPDGDFTRVPGRRHYLNVWEQLGHKHPPGEGIALDEAHPDDRARFEEAARRYLAGETAEFETEIRVRHVDGSYRTMLARGAAVCSTADKSTRFVGVVVDITRLKCAEEALRASERQFRTFVDHAADAFFLQHGEQGRILDVNRQACASLGYTRNELIGKTPFDLDPDVLPANLEEFIRQLDAGQQATFESRHRRKDGTVFPVEVRAQAFWEGGQRFFVTLARDITDRKRLDAELRRAMAAAEAANRAKDEFLANVSHEIRTPMNAILGMTELALETELTEEQRQWLKTVKTAADNLLGILNDLLDFAKIEAGKLELNPASFLLRAAVGDTLRTLAVRAHKKGLELICQVQPDVPDALLGDASRLRQVLLNLVGNAIKFTDAGTVAVSVDVALAGADQSTTKGADQSTTNPSPEGEITLRFQVRDTGIGIPRDQQVRIFRAFEQEDSSTTRKYGGTGLGLTIAARLVALMGGQIRVESAPGQGSTFAFTARLRKDDQVTRWQGDKVTEVNSAPVTLPPGHPVTLSILVAEDNQLNAELLQHLLVRRGHRVRLAGTGREAVAQAKVASFDLLLLDIHMPELDGFQVIQAIRERERITGGHLPVIALTARSRKEDREQCLAARMDEFLAKPIQAANLWAAIERVAARPAADRARPELIDARVLRAACGGDAVLLDRLCQVFRARLPENLDAVRAALQDGQALRLREAAHKLCGMLSTFSTVAGGVASDLEDQAARGQLVEAPVLVERLETMARELLQRTACLSLADL
jgi:PAS domain S-box-containing protein